MTVCIPYKLSLWRGIVRDFIAGDDSAYLRAPWSLCPHP